MGYGSFDRPFGRVHSGLVDIAPAPVLPRLERFHDGMTCLPEMRGGVLVLRAVAATDMPAGHAQPEVEPCIPGAQAVFAAVGAWRDHLELIEMCASSHRAFERTTFAATLSAR